MAQQPSSSRETQSDMCDEPSIQWFYLHPCLQAAICEGLHISQPQVPAGGRELVRAEADEASGQLGGRENVIEVDERVAVAAEVEQQVIQMSSESMKDSEDELEEGEIREDEEGDSLQTGEQNGSDGTEGAVLNPGSNQCQLPLAEATTATRATERSEGGLVAQDIVEARQKPPNHGTPTTAPTYGAPAIRTPIPTTAPTTITPSFGIRSNFSFGGYRAHPMDDDDGTPVLHDAQRVFPMGLQDDFVDSPQPLMTRRSAHEKIAFGHPQQLRNYCIPQKATHENPPMSSNWPRLGGFQGNNDNDDDVILVANPFLTSPSKKRKRDLEGDSEGRYLPPHLRNRSRNARSHSLILPQSTEPGCDSSGPGKITKGLEIFEWNSSRGQLTDKLATTDWRTLLAQPALPSSMRSTTRNLLQTPPLSLQGHVAITGSAQTGTGVGLSSINRSPLNKVAGNVPMATVPFYGQLKGPPSITHQTLPTNIMEESARVLRNYENMEPVPHSFLQPKSLTETTPPLLQATTGTNIAAKPRSAKRYATQAEVNSMRASIVLIQLQSIVSFGKGPPNSAEECVRRPDWKPYECSTCTEKFTTCWVLKEHLLHTHNIILAEDLLAWHCMYPGCRERFQKRSTCFRHAQTHFQLNTVEVDSKTNVIPKPTANEKQKPRKKKKRI